MELVHGGLVGGLDEDLVYVDVRRVAGDPDGDVGDVFSGESGACRAVSKGE